MSGDSNHAADQIIADLNESFSYPVNVHTQISDSNIKSDDSEVSEIHAQIVDIP